MGDATSFTAVWTVGRLLSPERTLEGRICSKPCSSATFSILLKYCRSMSVSTPRRSSKEYGELYLDGFHLQLERGVVISNNHRVWV